jgi:hypothetical protein
LPVVQAFVKQVQPVLAEICPSLQCQGLWLIGTVPNG